MIELNNVEARCRFGASTRLILIAVGPLWSHMPIADILWLLAGGIAYTGGVAFFAAERLPYHHFIWHLFVMTGTTCHFFAVLWYAS